MFMACCVHIVFVVVLYKISIKFIFIMCAGITSDMHDCVVFFCESKQKI